jgi:hypothetical protein
MQNNKHKTVDIPSTRPRITTAVVEMPSELGTATGLAEDGDISVAWAAASEPVFPSPRVMVAVSVTNNLVSVSVTRFVCRPLIFAFGDVVGRDIGTDEDDAAISTWCSETSWGVSYPTLLICRQ